MHITNPEEILMENVELIQGECSLCHGDIDEQWAGKNPGIGTLCQNCSGRGAELFKLENVELQVEKSLTYEPLFNKYEYHFNWSGTRVMINGQIGVVTQTYLGSCVVKFPNGNEWGDSIKTLDYWLLKDIYEESGGEMNPPALDFEEHVPEKATLLDEPILPVEINMDEDGNPSSIKVGNRSIYAGIVGSPSELRILPMLHAYCNLFVRYKFGLAPNFACEGGFHGHGFEVRNAGGFTGGCGLSVTMDRNARLFDGVQTEEDFRSMASMAGLIGFMVSEEERRAGVVESASAHEVLSTWVQVMETLLRYDWSTFVLGTVEDVWRAYCTMQDILLNVLTTDELQESLEFARGGRMTHAGSAF